MFPLNLLACEKFQIPMQTASEDVCLAAENESSKSPQDRAEAGNDRLSGLETPLNASPVTASVSTIMSSSLDLLKAYDFSDDEDEECQEVVESREAAAEAAPPVVQLSDDDSGPEECSSKVFPPAVSAVVEEEIVSVQSAGG